MGNELEVAISAAEAGGVILAKYFGSGMLSTRFKSDNSLQTTADIESEKAIIATIKKAFPHHAITSEEQGDIPSTSQKYRWLVDPLDGTENFILGIPYFSISIAFCDGNTPTKAVVYDPITRSLYVAEATKGARLNGSPMRVSKKADLKRASIFMIPDLSTKRSANTRRLWDRLYASCRRLLDTWAPALDWCLVASGKVEGIIVVSGQSIRANAGTLILEESGGRITDFQGNSFGKNDACCLVGSNGTSTHDQLLSIVKENFSD